MEKRTIVIIVAVVIVVAAVAVVLCSSPNSQDDKPVLTNSTYYGNGGLTADGESSVTNNVSVTLDAVFFRDGYTMTGWNTKQDDSGTSYGFYKNTNGEQQFYAMWEQDVKQYSISYSYRSVHDYNIVVEHDGKKETLTKENIMSVTKPKINVTVSASVSEMVYYICDANGRSMFKLTDGTYNTFYFTNVGSMVANSTSGSITFDITLTGDSTLTDSKLTDGYAYLEGNGGTIANSMHSTSMKEGHVTSEAKFEKSGYVFKSWNTKLDGSGQSYSVDTTVKAGMILFAQWEKA